MKNISKNLVGSLIALLDKGEISSTAIKDKALCERLLVSGCIRKERLSRSRNRYVLIDAAALRTCCRDYDLRLKDLEGLYEDLCNGMELAPSDYISKYGKDHIGKRNLWHGFFIRSNVPVKISYSGQSWVLSDSWPFLVEEPSLLQIDAHEFDLWVVENYECFKDLSWMKHFSNGDGKAIIVCRWPQSKRARESFPTLGVKNSYYFGDIDLGGIKVFQTEFASFLGADAFVVPDTYVRDLTESGSVEVFAEQKIYLGIKGLTPRLQKIIDDIKLSRKGLLQEFYL